MKHITIAATILSLFILISSFSFSQTVKNPISSGSYKVLSGNNFDKVVVDDLRIVSYKDNKPLYAFFIVEEKLGQYVLEVTSPEVQSIDKNQKRDRKLATAKIEYQDANVCKLIFAYSNGVREKITLEKQ
ncbi:MAG: hypothetical protein M9916_03005 [Crocinitomicaceae bacterium]|nr:hypothetical protein [Crocinitomicaceae bacterium]